MTYVLGSIDLVRGREDYVFFGPLTGDHMYMLSRLKTEVRRRNCLTSWYGHHGGAYAWSEYRRLYRLNLKIDNASTLVSNVVPHIVTSAVSQTV